MFSFVDRSGTAVGTDLWPTARITSVRLANNRGRCVELAPHAFSPHFPSIPVVPISVSKGVNVLPIAPTVEAWAQVVLLAIDDLAAAAIAAAAPVPVHGKHFFV